MPPPGPNVCDGRRIVMPLPLPNFPSAWATMKTSSQATLFRPYSHTGRGGADSVVGITVCVFPYVQTVEQKTKCPVLPANARTSDSACAALKQIMSITASHDVVANCFSN